ncbi:hypothetical protein CJO81_03455 [Ralstonia solanacearum]|nr:hypothetical protein F504_2823 [Ralstonia pseudosolanacearum FQY_4]AST28392.1 hypothetical protein CDC45_14755 [Ralstonia pseudosolanacearum]AVV68139.1 hypothetical protein RSOE_22575 [Ralstonia solanacearum OE1-1]AXV70929.1 hypothetical protein CJO74_02935 [Ralstonia solanacearum]AST88045.1 hypothetical protein CIG66_02660 [Ralstonia pseudosolanacearum]
MESRCAGGGGKRGCIHGGPIIAAGGGSALRRRKVRLGHTMAARSCRMAWRSRARVRSRVRRISSRRE